MLVVWCGRQGDQPFTIAGFRGFQLVDEQQTVVGQFICLPDSFLELWVGCPCAFKTDAKAPILK